MGKLELRLTGYSPDEHAIFRADIHLDKTTITVPFMVPKGDDDRHSRKLAYDALYQFLSDAQSVVQDDAIRFLNS